MVSTYDNRYREFLARLRQARLAAGLTQKEVAAQLGKPQSYVSRSENGERRVDAVELADFAAVYGVEITKLIPSALENESATEAADGKDK